MRCEGYFICGYRHLIFNRCKNQGGGPGSFCYMNVYPGRQKGDPEGDLEQENTPSTVSVYQNF